jgi:tetratricopeptide (TPR) repeat protein
VEGATVTDAETMQLLARAVQAARGGADSQAEALICVRLAERRIDALGTAVSSAEMMDFLGNAVAAYEGIGMLDLAAQRLTRLCQLAEQSAPNTVETAGDYSRLALLLERHGDIDDAIMALERSVEHLRGAGAYERYAPGYESLFARLRGAGG